MRRWNIFARELADILATRGLGLGHLDDRAYIHPEKVRRLRHSLDNPASLPVLNVEEMDSVIEAFRLNRDEMLRLRAAILATGIENMLMKRIDPDNALTAAEQAFPYVLNAMRQSQGFARGLALMKGSDTNSIEGDALNMALGAAWDAIDDATIALHLSYNVSSLKRSIDYARDALNAFETALQELDDVRDEVKATEDWLVWFDEAQKGRKTAKKRLEELGA